MEVKNVGIKLGRNVEDTKSDIELGRNVEDTKSDIELGRIGEHN